MMHDAWCLDQRLLTNNCSWSGGDSAISISFLHNQFQTQRLKLWLITIWRLHCAYGSSSVTFAIWHRNSRIQHLTKSTWRYWSTNIHSYLLLWETTMSRFAQTETTNGLFRLIYVVWLPQLEQVDLTLRVRDSVLNRGIGDNLIPMFMIHAKQ
jgi:hypothetical protein